MAPTSVTLAFTADLHGCVSPIDSLTRGPAAGGFARTATLIRGIRDRDPDTVYVDLGDLVQGTPMSYLAISESPPHPMVRVLRRLGCAGLVVGNHEFNFGQAFREDLVRTSPFPILAANVVDERGELAFVPYLLVRVREKTIALLALTTPQVPRWEEPAHIEGLLFRDAVQTAREWVPRLRSDADAVIVAAHMGWEGVTDGGLELPSPPENDVARLVAEVPGIDAVVMAHTHEIVERVERGVVVVQPGARGVAVAELRLSWDSEDARVRVRSTVHRVGNDTRVDDTVLAEVAREEQAAAAWLDEVVATASGPFLLDGLRYRDNEVLSLLHQVNFDAAGTDLSSAALFHPRATLAAGDVCVRNLFRIYPFENDLTIVELTVDQVREYLEQIALAYAGPAVNGAPPPLHPSVRLYNHDAIAGVEYVIDPSLPPGRRVAALTFRGTELGGSHRLSMSASSYRVQGGGGYDVFRRSRVVERTGREMRALLIDWSRERRVLEPFVFDNWSVIGFRG
jgi:2',3'-cyclic-nucleotide 2'-phosphodiesterase/3'-nucleotidase